MEIDYRGANCVVIKDKNALIVVDPTANAQAKEAQNPEAVILATQPAFAPAEGEAKGFGIDMPGQRARHRRTGTLSRRRACPRCGNVPDRDHGRGDCHHWSYGCASDG